MKASEDFGEAIDKIDNLRAALDIPMPNEFHVKQMKRELEELSTELKKIYTEEEGKNPWEE